MDPDFLIAAPGYSHKSAGIRALYRLCHHLNRVGYRAAMLPIAGRRPFGELPPWLCSAHAGSVGDSIVIYPEIVSGNPYGARRVVRWALNNPGLLGGDTTYSDDEIVFVYDPQKLEIVNRAVNAPLGEERVLWIWVVDPAYIHPDPSVPKTIDCSYTGKGRALRERFPLPKDADICRLEDLTPDMAALGDTLRRTRTLYSYDHYSNLLREAVICGCEVRVMGEQGEWHDPRHCDCPTNVLWHADLEENYAARFHDSLCVRGFVRELRTRWAIPVAPALTAGSGS